MVGVLSNKIQRDELKPGDHIYSWRHSYLYAHHGIYVGNGNVIHFTRGAGQEIGSGTVLDRFIFSSSPSTPSDSPCPRCGDHSNLDGVISSCLDCFLSGGELYLFQYGVSMSLFLAKVRGGTCTLAHSDPSEDAVYRSEYLLQNGFGDYHVFNNNCEDFAIYCKTGLLVFTTVSVGRSGQASSLLAAVSAVVSSPLRFMSTGFTGLAAVGCGVYCISRIVSDIGVRRDVLKIPVERLVARSSLNELALTTHAPTSEESLNAPEVTITEALKECLNEPDVTTPSAGSKESLYETEMRAQAPKKSSNEPEITSEAPKKSLNDPEKTEQDRKKLKSS